MFTSLPFSLSLISLPFSLSLSHLYRCISLSRTHISFTQVVSASDRFTQLTPIPRRRSNVFNFDGRRHFPELKQFQLSWKKKLAKKIISKKKSSCDVIESVGSWSWLKKKNKRTNERRNWKKNVFLKCVLGVKNSWTCSTFFLSFSSSGLSDCSLLLQLLLSFQC